MEELVVLRKKVAHLRKLLDERTPAIRALLRRRGFMIYKREPADDLLIPAKKFVNQYYRMLHKYSFRLFLRDVIKHQDLFSVDQVARYASPEATTEYLRFLVSIHIVKKTAAGYTLIKRPIRSFGTTLEWYVAEVFKKEFESEAVWGVKFRRPRVGGDYDVLAKFEGSVAYIEVKASPPKQIYDSEIAAFLDRVDDLAPEIAVFLMDTELRMKDKIVPLFEKELAKRFADPLPVTRMERELFQIRDRIFIINARQDIADNLEKAMSWYYRNV